MESIGLRDLVVLLLLFLAVFFGVAILIFMAVVIRRRQRVEAGDGNPRCSFCLKNQGLVKYLIAGPSAYICNECVIVCNEIVSRDSRKEGLLDFPG